MNYQTLLTPIHQFLHCRTPQCWIDIARQPENLPLLLTDHMVCELKAAQTAMLLIRRYVADERSSDLLLNALKPWEDYVFNGAPKPDFLALHKGLSKAVIPKAENSWGEDLTESMILLIKEELHHFYQVWEIMQSRQIPYIKITASRYAKGLLSEVRTHEPLTLIDKLICGAFIEARSCERFASLAPYLDSELEAFYVSLLRSEARHYQDYLALAERIAGENINERIRHFAQLEAELIQSPDNEFRFHSGIPVVA